MNGGSPFLSGLNLGWLHSFPGFSSSWLNGLNGLSVTWLHALWRASWQGGLALAVAWLLCHQLPRLSRGVRCWIWRLAYLKLIYALFWSPTLALPLPDSLESSISPVMAVLRNEITAASPPISLPQEILSNQSAAVASASSTPAHPYTQTVLGNGSQRVDSFPQNWGAGGPVPVTPPRIGGPGGPKLSTRDGAASEPWLSLGLRSGTPIHPSTHTSPHSYIPTGIALLWLLGAGCCAVRTWRRWQTMRRWLAGCQPVEQEDVLEYAGALARKLGLRRLPRLVAGRVSSPFVTGVWRPTIVLPLDALELPTSRDVHLAIAHELAHVRRRDLHWNGFLLTAQVLFFFHPLVRIAYREWEIAHEIACDELAMTTAGTSLQEYGQMLIIFASRPWSGPPAGMLSVGTLGAHTKLKRRFIAMSQIETRASQRMLITGVGAALFLMVGLAPWQVVAKQPGTRAAYVKARHRVAVAKAPGARFRSRWNRTSTTSARRASLQRAVTRRAQVPVGMQTRQAGLQLLRVAAHPAQVQVKRPTGQSQAPARVEPHPVQAQSNGRPDKAMAAKQPAVVEQTGPATNLAASKHPSPDSASRERQALAEIRLQNAQERFAIVQAQYRAGAVTGQEFEDAQYAVDIAKAEVDQRPTRERYAITLQHAERMLALAKQRYAAGLTDFRELEDAQYAADLAKAEMDQRPARDRAALAVEHARRVLSVIQERYKAGAATSLELNQARADLEEARAMMQALALDFIQDGQP